MLLLCLALLGEGAGAASLDQRVTLDIAAGTPLEQGLIDLVKNAGMLFSASALSLAGHPLPGLKGTFTVAIALSVFLQGTGLSYKIVNRTLFVYSPRADANVEANAAPAPYEQEQTVTRSANANRRREPPADGAALSEVTIAGSHIPGSALASLSIVLDRDYLDTAGYQTLGEFVRSLPQSFGGGFNPGVISVSGSQNTASQSAASTANLLGMGSAATLTLINGQRVATSEGSGAVDLTLIPISAVDHIDVLTGGASAVYGSDAVAGVVNIALRTDYQGVQLTGATGTATDRGDTLHHYSLMAGHLWNSGNLFALQDCAWQNAIDANQRSYVPSALAGTTLLPRMQNCSTVVSATRELPGDIEASVLGVYTSRSSYQTQRLTSSSPDLTELLPADVGQYTVNATFREPLASRWMAVVSAGFSADNVSAPETLSIDGFQYQQGERVDNRMRSVEGQVNGTLLELPTGALQVALGAGSNQEDFLFTSLPESGYSIAARRSVAFAYTEAAIPVLGSVSAPSDPELTVDIAARTERYSDVGSTMNPKIGILYRPALELRVAASWGTSFRAPLLLQEYSPSSSYLEFIPNLTAPGGRSLVLFRFGGNQQLHAEKSQDSTLGLTFTPLALPGASFQLSYYNILYQQKIDYPPVNTANLLSDPNVQPFIVRDPSRTLIDQILAQSPLQSFPGGPYAAADATVVIDDRYQNITRQRASGVDFFANYSHETPLGRIGGSLDLAHLDLKQQATTSSAVLTLSGTVFNPPLWRGRMGVNWNYERFLGSVHVNYTGPSRNQAVGPPQAVASWTTVDTQVGCALQGRGLLGHTRVGLFVRNVFDRPPPYVNMGQVGVNYDWTNSSPAGRVVVGEVTVEW